MAQCVIVEYKDGSKYCGEADGGTLQGCGTLVEASNKGVFEGLWAKNNQLRGVFSWPNGKHYAGDWKGSMRSGLGVETRPDGTKYSGDFSQNAMGPLGVLSLPTHGVYMGMWDHSGMQEGDGVEAYADGGYYRGQYKSGQRGGYGTRSSAGYEKRRESFPDLSNKTKELKINHPSVTSVMARTLDKKSDAGALMSDTRGNWKQIYEGQWTNDKRCGYGVLKVSECFTYYGEWKENTRTGYGVLIHEAQNSGKKGKGNEEQKEEGKWDNGKLIEPVKYTRMMKSELKLRVDDAHREAIKAASRAREQAVIAESKANAAAAKSKIAEQRAVEARQHAESASSKVQHTATISQQVVEDVCKIKGSIRITINGQRCGDFASPKQLPAPKRLDSSHDLFLGRSTSYGYLQCVAEKNAPHYSKGIPSVSSCHNISSARAED